MSAAQNTEIASEISPTRNKELERGRRISVADPAWGCGIQIKKKYLDLTDQKYRNEE